MRNINGVRIGEGVPSEEKWRCKVCTYTNENEHDIC